MQFIFLMVFDMTTQTIEVEGLPEGWKVKEYRMPNKGDYFWYQNRVCVASGSFIDQRLIIEKIQPRRIVLEEISKEEYHRLFNDERCSDIYNMRGSYWRYVKENDLSLTNEEPKLSLSVAQCKKFFNGTITDRLEVFQLVEDFIKDK